MEFFQGFFFLACGSQSGPETQSDLSPTSGRIVGFGSFGFTISSSVENITGAGFTLWSVAGFENGINPLLSSEKL